jgi:hypothetical protein
MSAGHDSLTVIQSLCESVLPGLLIRNLITQNKYLYQNPIL